MYWISRVCGNNKIQLKSNKLLLKSTYGNTQVLVPKKGGVGHVLALTCLGHPKTGKGVMSWNSRVRNPKTPNT